MKNYKICITMISLGMLVASNVYAENSCLNKTTRFSQSTFPNGWERVSVAGTISKITYRPHGWSSSKTKVFFRDPTAQDACNDEAANKTIEKSVKGSFFVWINEGDGVNVELNQKRVLALSLGGGGGCGNSQIATKDAIEDAFENNRSITIHYIHPKNWSQSSVDCDGNGGENTLVTVPVNYEPGYIIGVTVP